MVIRATVPVDPAYPVYPSPKFLSIYNQDNDTSTNVCSNALGTNPLQFFILFFKTFHYVTFTFGSIIARRLLIYFPPCPSNTAANVDLGQLGRKQSCTKDAKYA